MTSILVGIAGAIVVLLLPARQEAVALVQVVSADTREVVNTRDALAMLRDDAVVAAVLQRVQPDLADSIDPRPVDPVVAFRRSFSLDASSDDTGLRVAYSARSAQTATRVVQTWLQVTGDAIAAQPMAATVAADAQRSGRNAAVDDGAARTGNDPVNADALRAYRDQVTALEQELASAQAALLDYDTNANKAAAVADDEAAQRQRQQQQAMRTLQTRLDAAIADGGALEARLGAMPQTVTERVAQAPPARPARSAVDTQLQARVQEAEAALEGLRVRFTDSHPDVRRQMSLIAELRAARDAGAPAGADNAAAAAAEPVFIQREVPNPEWRTLEREVVRARREVANLRAQLAQAQNEVNAGRAVSADASASGQRASDTQRLALVAAVDEATTALVDARALNPANRSATATIAADAGAATRAGPSGARDAAGGPMMPVSLVVLQEPVVGPATTNPDRQLWLQRVLLASLAIGALTALALSLRRVGWHDARSLERATGFQSLGEIPFFNTTSGRLRSLMKWFFFLLLVALYVVVFLVMMRVFDSGVQLGAITVAQVGDALSAVLQSAQDAVLALFNGVQRSGEAR